MIDEVAIEAICAQTAMTHDAVYAWRSRLGKLARKLLAEITADAGDAPS